MEKVGEPVLTVGSIQNGDTGHACAQHHLVCHQGEPLNFTMKVLRGYKYPLQRQTFEGRLIADFNGIEILYKKGEWGCNLPPTLTTGDENVSNRVRGMEPRADSEGAQQNPPPRKRLRGKVPPYMRTETDEIHLRKAQNQPKTSLRKSQNQGQMSLMDQL